MDIICYEARTLAHAPRNTSCDQNHLPMWSHKNVSPPLAPRLLRPTTPVTVPFHLPRDRAPRVLRFSARTLLSFPSNLVCFHCRYFIRAGVDSYDPPPSRDCPPPSSIGRPYLPRDGLRAWWREGPGRRIGRIIDGCSPHGRAFVNGRPGARAKCRHQRTSVGGNCKSRSSCGGGRGGFIVAPPP